jgi:signal transduction histidine kinase
VIDNVLDFARIEQNRKTYHFAETDVSALVRDAIELFEPRAAQRGQKIESQLETIEPPPVSDGIAIQQALINHLTNNNPTYYIL